MTGFEPRTSIDVKSDWKLSLKNCDNVRTEMLSPQKKNYLF